MKIAQPVIAVILVAVLTGCTTPSAVPNDSGSATTTSTPSPSASGDRLPAGALFRITAVFATPSGESARLVETVMAPVAGSGDEASRMTAAHCDAGVWKSAYPSPSWMTVTVTTKLLTGTTWPVSADAIIAQVDGLQAYPAAFGGIRTYQAYCASGLVGVPATGTYLLPVDGASPPDSATSWGHGTYGFVWAADGQDASAAPFSVTSCTLERSDATAASAAVSSWNPSLPDPGSGSIVVGCDWGTI